ncbi:hypothetical protein [Alteromonas mediterranea]|uniref:hypothetical protein n=1 Tax=Alteromonas mediterranea TaxID=314275 RepID=UPI000EE87626|nr:hypothetical protein [Pseudoalteromonas sp.]|tara:strand:+ start:1350 stop:1601 length:252 start_codon:yes stop_codon:yes gene_type:complete
MEKTKASLRDWSKDFLSDLFAPAEQKAIKTAEVIDKIDTVAPATATELDDIAKAIEKKKKQAPEPAKVTSNRKKRRRKRTNSS